MLSVILYPVFLYTLYFYRHDPYIASKPYHIVTFRFTEVVRDHAGSWFSYVSYHRF